jgi:hypothetical protein
VSGHDTRRDITAALAGLDGVTALAYAPATVVAGMAWPLWVSTVPLTGCAWSWTYDVVYVLAGGDVGTAAAAAESAVEPIASRLAEVGEIVLVEPALITAGDAGRSLPAVRFRIITQ